MGGATVEGMIKADYFDNKDLMVSDPAEVVLKKFSAQGIRTTTDNAAAAKEADVVMVFVKPWLVETVLKGIKDSLNPEKQILVVIAAGVKSASIQEWLGAQCPRCSSVSPISPLQNWHP